jgi:hypothetical protein
VRNQARDRALAVGAGDADDRRAHRAREQFDVADDLDAARTRLRGDRLLERDSGDISSCVAPSSSDRSKPPRRMSRRSRSEPELAPEPGGSLRVSVALPRRRASRDTAGRSAGFAETHDDAAHQRIFKVARPANTSTKLMIQKRTITFGSAQPLSSK